MFKWRIIGQYTCRIIINLQSLPNTFDGDTRIFVRQNPVQLCRRKLWGEYGSHQIHLRQHFLRLFYRCALGKNPWNELKLSHVFPSLLYLLVDSVSYEVQPCHSKAFFIDRIVIQRVIVRYMCHTDDRIMIFQFFHMAKMKRIISWCYCNLISIGEFIIQRPSHIKIFCLISSCCTHFHLLLLSKIFAWLFCFFSLF